MQSELFSSLLTAVHILTLSAILSKLFHLKIDILENFDCQDFASAPGANANGSAKNCANTITVIVGSFIS
jgi:hypothetical protein